MVWVESGSHWKHSERSINSRCEWSTICCSPGRRQWNLLVQSLAAFRFMVELEQVARLDALSANTRIITCLLELSADRRSLRFAAFASRLWLRLSLITDEYSKAADRLTFLIFGC